MKVDVQTAQMILSVLKDEKSKLYFLYRLLYSLTGNIEYIYDMIKIDGVIKEENIIANSNHGQELYNLYENSDLLRFIYEKKGKSKEIVIFGCGNCGKEVSYWLGCIGIRVTCFCDNDDLKQGTYIENIPVLSPCVLEKELKGAVIIIASVLYHTEIKEQLDKMNINHSMVYEYERNWLLSYIGEPYFDCSIFEPREHEIFVDAGAYCGETVEEFIRWCPNYDQIYSFEPDEKNYKRLLQNIRINNIGKIKTVNAGLWSNNGLLNFEHCGDDGTGSHIVDASESKVKVISLDRYLFGEKVTYIKMDIEGAELEALKGARETIQKYKPRLAICIYHKNEDIIQIPQYLLQLVPEYKFKIRHYTTYLYDTILYAE